VAIPRKRVELAPEAYDQRWEERRAAGHEIHGEADLVAALLDELAGAPRGSVLDAGCGTGRVAIELARRGYPVVGVDVDQALLARARDKAPDIPWVLADLSELPSAVAAGPYDAVVMAGNVMIFVARGTEAPVLAHLASRLAPGGFLVAGFQLAPERITRAEYDEHAVAAGLTPYARWSTWDRAELDPSSTYLVTVDRRGDARRAGENP
jgi:SAM-dependent methyltransferase